MANAFDTYRVLWDFHGEHEDELDCNEGQLVQLLIRVDSDWAKVSSKETGQGLIPWSYIAPVVNSPTGHDVVVAEPVFGTVNDSYLASAPPPPYQQVHYPVPPSKADAGGDDDDDLFSRFNALSTSAAAAAPPPAKSGFSPDLSSSQRPGAAITRGGGPPTRPPLENPFEQFEDLSALPSADDLQRRFLVLKTRIESEAATTSSPQQQRVDTDNKKAAAAAAAAFHLPDPPSLPPRVDSSTPPSPPPPPPPLPPMPPKDSSSPPQRTRGNGPVQPLPPPPPSTAVQAALEREAIERARLAQLEEARKEIERAQLQREADEAALRLRQQNLQAAQAPNSGSNRSVVTMATTTSGPNYITLGQQYTKQAITHFNNARYGDASRDYGRALIYFKQAFDQGVVPMASKLQILGWMETLLEKLFEPPVWSKTNEFKDRAAVLRTMCANGYVARPKAAEFRLRALEYDKSNAYEEAVFFYSASVEYLMAHHKVCKDQGKPTEADVMKTIAEMLDRAETLKTVIKRRATQL